MNKEQITVSAEVKTYLSDLYNQIEYELRVDYEDGLEKAANEIERLNNIINKINKMLEADTHSENIYYAIGVLLNKRYFDIKMVDNEELLNILGSDEE